jgi:hypothetical protein
MFPNPSQQPLSHLLGPTHPETHPTHILVETGEFLQALLKPSTITVLLAAIETKPQTPADLEPNVWCTPGTVAEDFHTITTFSLPLVRKTAPDEPYAFTKIIINIGGLLNQVSDNLGDMFTDLDYTDPQTKAQIATVLTPLSTIERPLPWFILDALREVSGTNGFDDTPDPIALNDIVAEITQRQHQRGEDVAPGEVDQILTHFADTDLLFFDGDECTLTEKGNLYVILFHAIAEMFELRRQIMLLVLTWRGEELNGAALCDLINADTELCATHLTDLETMGIIEQRDPSPDALVSSSEGPLYRVDMDNPIVAQLDESIEQAAQGP